MAAEGKGTPGRATPVACSFCKPLVGRGPCVAFSVPRFDPVDPTAVEVRLAPTSTAAPDAVKAAIAQ